MNLGMPEMLFIFLLALVVFGPRKLPELARQMGKFVAEFKRASNEFKYQLENEIEQLDVQDRQQKRETASTGSGAIPGGSLERVPFEEAQNIVNNLLANSAAAKVEGSVAREAQPASPAEPVAPAESQSEATHRETNG